MGAALLVERRQSAGRIVNAEPKFPIAPGAVRRFALRDMSNEARHGARNEWIAAGLWALAGFCFGYYYSQFIVKIGWNAIELIIAQHLLDHARYVTGLDYPSAIAWRPVVPTLFVTVVRLFSTDPLEIYRTVCGIAFAAMSGSVYLAGKRLWGQVAGHTGAALCLACPAITTYLVHHIHSYSNIVTLAVLGPTLLMSLSLLVENLGEAERRPRRYVSVSILWTLAYLCRSELLLFALIYFVALAIVHWRTKISFARLGWAVIPFLILFVGYNQYANYVCNRDGTLIRKPVYGFYMSQGWVDPAPDAGPDTEGDGYRYALRLYGDPLSNDESLIKAIRRNPEAFVRRVRINFGNFYAKYWDDAFFPKVYTVCALGAVFLYGVGLVRRTERNPVAVPFLVLLFLASHFILIFHIDPRYLSINIVPLVLLAAYGLGSLIDLLPRGPSLAIGLIAVVVLLGLQIKRQWIAVAHHGPRNEKGTLAIKGLAEHFNSLGLKHSGLGNREPHISLEFPSPSPIEPEDEFLLPYFTETSYVNGGANGPFPRGKFYAYADSPIDFRYVPAAKIKEPRFLQGMHIISDCENPILGKYFLLQANPPGVTTAH